jgi:wobble nucleotide-excising tRNase
MGSLCFDHVFKQDEQWGEALSFNSQFDEVGDCKQRVVLHHNTYFEQQDSTTADDVIDQCIYAAHMSNTITEHEGTIFYDAFQSEVADAPHPHFYAGYYT